jgi:eukaryotic-like serine/threonine-protein kinase
VERIADYQFVRSLGDGNHGQFYLARKPARLPVDAEYVAVKVLGANGSGDAFRRMTKELKLFASIRSPFLVQLYDAGQEGNLFYYSMEYFPLGSLAAPARPLLRTEILRAVAHAARAAHALHEAGVAHRDIKPSNIMVHEDGAKLSDLGLAQVLSPGLTVTGMGMIGSVEYMDPGTMKGERPSRASDVWSLGVTLHRALTGQGVYGELPAGDPLLILRRVLNTQPSLAPGLQPHEAQIIGQCLHPDAASRPPTAEAVADQLDGLVGAAV